MNSIQLPEEMSRRLADFEAKKNPSEIACIQEALEQFFLDEEGDAWAADLALARLAKGGPSVSLEEARRQLGLLDGE